MMSGFLFLGRKEKGGFVLAGAGGLGIAYMVWRFSKRAWAGAGVGKGFLLIAAGCIGTTELWGTFMNVLRPLLFRGPLPCLRLGHTKRYRFPHLAFPREMQSKRPYLGDKVQNSRDPGCPHLILPSVRQGESFSGSLRLPFPPQD